MPPNYYRLLAFWHKYGRITENVSYMKNKDRIFNLDKIKVGDILLAAPASFLEFDGSTNREVYTSAVVVIVEKSPAIVKGHIINILYDGDADDEDQVYYFGGPHDTEHRFVLHARSDTFGLRCEQEVAEGIFAGHGNFRKVDTLYNLSLLDRNETMVKLIKGCIYWLEAELIDLLSTKQLIPIGVSLTRDLLERSRMHSSEESEIFWKDMFYQYGRREQFILVQTEEFRMDDCQMFDQHP